MLDDLIDSLGLAEFLDSQDVSRVEKRLMRVEKMLEALLAHHGIDIEQPATASGSPPPLSSEVSAEIMDRVKRGDKAAAVKLYREALGVSQEEARAVIERLDATL